MKKSLLMTSLMLIVISFVHAQVTTSSMTGSVSQVGGQPTAGATVKATHVPSGTVYTGTSTESGRFNLANMRVGGPYRVEVTYVGQSPEIYEDIFLQLGQPYVLNAILSDASTTLDEVVITASGAINVNKTGAGTNVSTQQIENLPQISRSVTEFTRLTPQASGNSFAGRDARYNNLQIDGANFNNGFGLSSNPLPGGNSQPISLDAIEEIQVNIAPFDVTQSGFTGAGINAVTRSGTNTFHGSVYGFFNNDYLTGRKIKDNLLEAEDGAKRNYGFRLGGPIIKDKLFFFVNVEREEATGANASGANLWKASSDGVANPDQYIARTRRDDLVAVRNHLINVWNYDPGRYEGYADEASQGATKILARIDYNISDIHKLSVRYNQVVGVNDQQANGNSGPYPRSSFNRVSQNSITFENGNYGFENTVRSVSAELNSNFNSRWSNQFLATYTRIQDLRTTPGDRLFPFVDIWDGGRADGNGNYMSFGTELFSFNNDVVNDNYSFINNLTYVAGRHTFTGGAAFEIQKFGNSYTRSGTSYYRYASVEDFLTTGTPNEVAPIMFSLTYPYEGQDTYARINFGLASLYLQDRVTVTDRLALTLGVRAELPLYLNDLTPNPAINAIELLDKDGNPTHYDSGSWPRSRVLISPRLGFNFDVLGDRSFILRGGSGFFSGRVPFVWLTNMPTNAGVLQNTIEPGSYDDVASWIGNVTFQPQDPYYYVKNPPRGAEGVFITTPSGGAPGSFALVDRDFKMPMVWRSSLGVDYKIPNSPVTLIADALYTRDINAVFQLGANRVASGNTMNYGGNPGDNREFFQPGQSTAYNPVMGGNNATVLTNTDVKGHAFSGTIGASIANFHNLSGSVFYTYSAAKEVSANAGSSASSAWSGSPNINSPNDQFLYASNFAVPHRVIANLNYRFQNTTIGLYYNGSHQGRFSYTYNADINNDGVNADLIYLPQNTADIPFSAYSVTINGVAYEFSVADQRAAFDAYAAENGLNKYRGDYLPRNAFLIPWLNRFDLRWTQDLFNNVGGQQNKIQFTADIVNVGNLLNRDWGIQKMFNNNMQNLLTRASATDESGVPSLRMNYIVEFNQERGRDEAVLPTSPFRDASTFGTTWSAQLGLRYTF
ncbi:Carboxypeptidase regulatory-like domain-containing protein [Parapedobacter luteus]|uniref:Carboxypeptidase regulatory-like domain-containing protein n=1 Tax=Parapedobacter luteus TaxID=623280 RepID=A0A1T5AXE6_9SPHI|nr:TonB-dependent receptor [Parapedobacter luteus]SKB39489.1 Carboxypeptidase regulatory-like domain-containing protein [Parapedobacter luteus]